MQLQRKLHYTLCGYYVFHRDMEQVCKYYSGLGVKGFKVDFMDRDDQK